ncbi:hypothetical protein SKAU_G00279750 [Synaphobranchus kaupii]|uniref:ribonuclease H n=1 Tax=Synaphobranchus kaupii TaxID=118154 RepID=A0A9Q1EWZ9_SYNKA|nr:hypothetical protein SKAU_G00279750 [Synaphobranchus kaupii]
MPTQPNTGGSAREGGPASGVQRVPGPSMVSSRKAEWAKGKESRPLRGKAFGDCLTIEVTIGGIKTNCLLDTGSEVTTISEPYYRKYFEGQESSLTSSKWVWLTAANGLDIPVLGCLEADIECMGKTLKGKCVFVLTNTGTAVEEMEQVPGIIGMNVISELQGLFIQSEGLKRMDRYGPHNGAANLRCVLARVERESQFVGPNGRIGYVKCQVLVEASQEASLPKELVANVLAEAADGRVPVRLLNSSGKAIKLPRRAWLAELYKPQEVFAKELVAVEEKEGALCQSSEARCKSGYRGRDQITGRPCPRHQGLTPSQLQEFNKLLQKHSDVFSKDENDFGYTTTVTHSILTGETHPIKQKHRRIPPQVFQEFKRHVQDLVTQGVLKESSSPWASPAVIVIRKDGSVRFCCDYRALNKVTCKDAYPLPRVEELLDALGKARLFSTLDLTAGYFQVAVSKEDQGKTAVTTPFGLFEWMHIPFGLCNAPATFQRLMEVVLGDLAFDVLLIYLDDIILFSESFKSHCKKLDLVFNHLKQHGLKLKPSKCFLLRTEVKFLGHVVSTDGIRVDKDKVKALED